MLNLFKNTLIILFIALLMGGSVLYISGKLFYSYDNKEQLDYMNKEALGNNPYEFTKGSIIEPILNKKLNGLLKTAGWSEKYTHSNGKVYYDVMMNVSEIGSRINLFQDENAKGHFIVVGDSQTFGIGVNDEDVYSNIFNKSYDSFNTYNMGFAGWNPSSNFLFFDPKVGVNLKRYIKEDKGVMVYLLYPYLTLRDNGFPSALHYTAGLLTHYVKEGEELVAKGTFKNSDSFILNLKKMATFYDKIEFYEENIMTLPYGFNERKLYQAAYDFTADIMSAMQKYYLEFFPGSKFYVAVCDNLYEDKKNDLNFSLKSKKLNIINLKDQSVCRRINPYSFPEFHMNEKGHQQMYELLNERVVNQNKNLLGLGE